MTANSLTLEMEQWDKRAVLDCTALSAHFPFPVFNLLLPLGISTEIDFSIDSEHVIFL